MAPQPSGKSRMGSSTTRKASVTRPTIDTTNIQLLPSTTYSPYTPTTANTTTTKSSSHRRSSSAARDVDPAKEQERLRKREALKARARALAAAHTPTKYGDERDIHPSCRTGGGGPNMPPTPASAGEQDFPPTPCTVWPSVENNFAFPSNNNTPISPASGRQPPIRSNTGKTDGSRTTNASSGSGDTNGTRQSVATTNTSYSSGGSPPGPDADRPGSQFMHIGLAPELYTLAMMEDGQIMDLRYTVAMMVREVSATSVYSLVQFLRPIVEASAEGRTKDRNVQSLSRITKELQVIMCPPVDKRKRSRDKVGERTKPDYVAINNVRCELSNVVQSLSHRAIFGPKVGEESKQSELMVLLLLYTRRPAAESSDQSQETGKYTRLARRIEKSTAPYRATSDFLTQWGYRLNLIAYFETVFWSNGCEPLARLIGPDTAVLPHHALSLAIAQLGLWPDSETKLKKKQLAQYDLANAMFLHMERHVIKHDFDPGFKYQMAKVQRAWLGHDRPVTEEKHSIGTNSSMQYGSLCEDRALARWKRHPRSATVASPPSPTGKANCDKPLPNPNQPIRKEWGSVTGADSASVLSDKAPGSVSPGSPTLAKDMLPDLEARKQRVRDGMQGKPRSWDPKPVIQPILSNITTTDNDNSVPRPMLQKSATTSTRPPKKLARAATTTTRAPKTPGTSKKDSFFSFFSGKSSKSTSGQTGRTAGRAQIPVISAPIIHVGGVPPSNQRGPNSPGANTKNTVPEDYKSIKSLSTKEREKLARQARKRHSLIRSPTQVSRDQEKEKGYQERIRNVKIATHKTLSETSFSGHRRKAPAPPPALEHKPARRATRERDGRTEPSSGRTRRKEGRSQPGDAKPKSGFSFSKLFS